MLQTGKYLLTTKDPELQTGGVCYDKGPLCYTMVNSTCAQNFTVDMSPALCHYRRTLGEATDQFPLTRAAFINAGAQTEIVIRNLQRNMIKKLCLLFGLIANGAYAADTIVINANVITVDPAHPAAQAFAFDNGRFTAVGTTEEMLKLKTSTTTVMDLKGQTVTPGFNDAHLHPQAIFDENSPYYRVWLGSDRVKTMDELVAALKRKAAITPAGKSISGYGYNDVTLGRHPNRHDLDKVRPISR